MPIDFTDKLAADCLWKRAGECNKGTFGYIALIGGCSRYSGAIRLANMAGCAMRAGAGVVKLAAPKSLQSVILPNILESTYFPLDDDGDGNYIYDEAKLVELTNSVSVVAIGMGIGNTDQTGKAVEYLLKKYKGILIIDADGLNALSSLDYTCLDESDAKIIITPHPGEFARLCNKATEEVVEGRIKLAEEFSRNHGVITLLKGSETVITDGRDTYLSSTGCAGMATAGSGDVLSGVIAAVCAYNKNQLLKATATASYITGLAGEMAEAKMGAISMVASDTASYIAEAVKKLSDSFN